LLVVAAIFHSVVVGVADTVVHGGGVVDGAATCSGGGGSADEVMDDKVAEAWQRGAVMAASRRFSASLSIGLGMTWGTVAAVNLAKRVASPHLLFKGLRDGGPPSSSWAGRPRLGPSQGSAQSLDWPGGDQPNRANTNDRVTGQVRKGLNSIIILGA